MPNIWLCTRPHVSSCASQRRGQTFVLGFGEKTVEKAQLLNAGVQVSPSQGGKFKRLLPVRIKDITMGAVNSPQGLRSLSVSFTSLHLHMLQHFSKVHLLCYCPGGLNTSQWDPNNSGRAQRMPQLAQQPFSPSYSQRRRRKIHLEIHQAEILFEAAPLRAAEAG